MSDELFEVAFSGQIKEGADLEQVKAKVGTMFKADATKLGHLFSGKRMVIKKNIDQATANKYQKALDNAGAVCEVKSLSETAQEKPVEVKAVEPEVKVTTAAPVVAIQSSTSAGSGVDAPDAPKTDPLGINADDISDLSADLAPVGSDMQDGVKDVAEPELDISGIGMAPVGSDLGQVKKDDDPPPPNTDGLTMVE